MIGPYRLGEILGRGGMGVVYSAWDERLERRVAIKHIHPDKAADPLSRERLRREARAVARLSHPAIVQIFDIVEKDDGDWIVMELVPGRTLASILNDGPLELDEVLPLVREVAEALSEAHGKGFLHRDLKTENVIVTPGGHAKILDFGLAKQFWPQDRDPRSRHPGARALSEEGALIGTRKSMSPEQVSGLKLDPRSDLFSFGVLLYETVTGLSPFKGSTPLQTLYRVQSHQQLPAKVSNPAVPKELSTLIDSLLEKDRDHRPRSGREVAEQLLALERSLGSAGSSGWSPSVDEETLVEKAPFPLIGSSVETPESRVAKRSIVHSSIPVVVAAVWFSVALVFVVIWWRMRQIEPPLYVAVLAPQIGLGADRDETQITARGLRSALLNGLVKLEHIAPLSPEEDASRDVAPRQTARRLAADEVIVSHLDCEQTCHVTLERLQVTDGMVIWTARFEVPIGDLELLASATRTYLGRAWPTHQWNEGLDPPRFNGEDYRRYLRLAEVFAARSEPLDEILRNVETLRRSSPEFLEVYLLEAEIASYRFFDSRDPEDLDRAFKTIRDARNLAPVDPRPLLIQFGIALPAERLDEAQEALEEFERLVPGDIRALQRRALLLERRGQIETALATMARAVELRPAVDTFIERANMELRLGEVATARQTLNALLQRFPHDRLGTALLAQLELVSGSVERAVELYGHLADRSGTFGELTNLGLAQMLLGTYEAAARSFERAHALAPKNLSANLNHADVLLLMGNVGKAQERYEMVIELVDRDPASEFWQNQTIKAQALAHLGRRPEAVATVQRALQSAPKNPQVSYEAALVYTLVGDRASALVNAIQALEAGFEERWFSFSWFDSLRQEPQFLALLNRDD